MLGGEYVVGERLFLADVDTPLERFGNDCQSFSTENEIMYIPYCDDFGPMNLADVIQFSNIANAMLERYPSSKIVYRVEKSPRKLTNAVFLMGSYMILALDKTPEEVWNVFKSLNSHVEMYRDATFSPPNFRLNLLDCWEGLARAKTLGWLEQYDMEEYVHYDNPLEGDLHTAVPGKLIAFRGPRSIPPPRAYADSNGCRLFAPRFYADAFSDMNVSTVVRLNEEEYDASEFESLGLTCVDLEFEDCTNPPLHIIIEFLYTVDRAPGAVAVHCKAGLGRTGTLIAIYMMRSHGFTARQAIGWLRIVRPGSVIGGQQHFLCTLDPPFAAAVAAATADDADRRPDGPVGDLPAAEPPERSSPPSSHESLSSLEDCDSAVISCRGRDGVAAADEGQGDADAGEISSAGSLAKAGISERSAAGVGAVGGVGGFEGRGPSGCGTMAQQQAAQIATALMSPQRTALKVQQSLSRLE